MKCNYCMRDISSAEMPKRIEYRKGPDGPLVYGINMPGGPLTAARGPLIKALHSKCYWVVEKRTQRGGDAVQGTHPGLVSAYDAEDQPTRLRQAREDDPDYRERPTSDWRDQEVHEVDEFR